MELTIDGRRMRIDSVDFNAGTVSLRDLDIPNYSIFRSESIAFVRSFIEEQQWKAPEMEQATLPDNEESPDLAKAKELINQFCEEEYDSPADFSDLEHIGITNTTSEDGKHEIQAEIDLVHYNVNQYVDGECVHKDSYASLEEMITQGLSGLDFGSLTDVPEETAEIQPEQAPAWVEIDGGEVSHTIISLVPEPVIPAKDLHNFHITDDDLGIGGPKTKYQYNVAAIRTLKQIEAENRTQPRRNRKPCHAMWDGGRLQMPLTLTDRTGQKNMKNSKGY